MSKNSLREKFYDLWKIAHKFSGGNSKITKQIEEYIKETCLNDTFVIKTKNGEEKTLPVFELAEPRNGKQTPYFNPLAMDSFVASRGEELRHKAKEFDENCPTVPLRILRRTLGLTIPKEKELLKFIETKCLHDTFLLQNEDGSFSEELIFDYPMDNHSKAYLSVQKKGVIPFIRAHQEELQKLGAKNLTALIESIPAFNKEEGLLQRGGIFKELRLSNQERNTFNQLFFNLLVHKKITDEYGQSQPLFIKRKVRQQTVYCLRKEDLPTLIYSFQEELKAIGLRQAVIDHYLNQKTISKKTKEMITLSDFSVHFLHSRLVTPLLTAIRQHHLTDTYETVDDQGNIVQKPVFIKVGSKEDNSKNYVFADKEAVFHFARKNKDLLLSHQITAFQYENIFREEGANIPEGEAVLVQDLAAKYHFFGQKHLSQIPTFALETYTTTDQNGDKIEKPLLFRKRQKSGHLRYYILKEAIWHLLTKHQKELNVQKTTLKAILAHKPILIRTESMLTMENLAEFLEYPKHFYPRLARFIETTCLNEKHIHPQTQKEKNTFVYAMSQSGIIALMIDSSGMRDFLSKYKNDLIKLGVNPNNINKALLNAKNNPNFHQEFVLKRRLRQEVYNERDRQNKNRQKD